MRLLSILAHFYASVAEAIIGDPTCIIKFHSHRQNTHKETSADK